MRNLKGGTSGGLTILIGASALFSAAAIWGTAFAADSAVGPGAFIGNWCGNWDNAVFSKLEVSFIGTDGDVRGRYNWFGSGGKGQRSFNGAIVEGRLQFAFADLNDAALTYSVGEGGKLEGIWQDQGGQSRTISMSRCKSTVPSHKNAWDP